MAETLVSNCQQMNNEIHQFLFRSAAIFMLRSETFHTILVYVPKMTNLRNNIMRLFNTEMFYQVPSVEIINIINSC